MEIIREKPLRTMDDLSTLRKFIEEENKFISVCLTNWIRIKPRKDAKKFFEENKK